jgi:3-hydroxyisobutyrate dehydrogenase
MTQPKRVGFIGLGMMGAPMVQCLAARGFELYLDDADAARADTLAAQTGGQRLQDGNAAALDVLITMLPNSAIVEHVLLGAARTVGRAGSRVARSLST